MTYITCEPSVRYEFSPSPVTFMVNGGIMPAIPKDYLKQIKSIVEDIVADIERSNGHYPTDVIDRVFLEIENNYMQEYDSWITLPNGASNEHSVNPYIGSLVSRITGLKVLAYPVKPNSRLIKGYSTLGY